MVDVNGLRGCEYVSGAGVQKIWIWGCHETTVVLPRH
jgi:hypothetical protein